MYCGDHEHCDLLNEVFSQFFRVNTLHRDMCPSATKFEAEIITMTFDLLGVSVLSASTPVGMLTSGSSGSIACASLCT